MDSSPVGDQKPEVWGCLDVSLGSAKLGTPNEHPREMPRASEQVWDNRRVPLEHLRTCSECVETIKREDSVEHSWAWTHPLAVEPSSYWSVPLL